MGWFTGRSAVIPQVLGGLNQILGLVGGVQNLMQARDQQAQQKALLPVTVARLLNPNADVPLTEEQGQNIKKTVGFEPPRSTMEGQAQTLGQLWQGMSQGAAPAETDTMANGVQVKPGSITSPTDPSQTARMATETKTLASLPEVGQYVLPGKAPTTLDEALLRTIKPGEDIRGLYQMVKGKQQRPLVTSGGVLDWQGNKIADIPEGTTTFYDPVKGTTVKVPGKGAKQLQDPERLETIRQGNRMSLQDRKDMEIGPSGLPEPKVRGNKATGLYGNMKIAAQENGLDLSNEADFKKAMSLVQPGRMTDEKKQIARIWQQVWKESQAEPTITLPDGSRKGYGSLSPAEQAQWRKQNFESKLQELGGTQGQGQGQQYQLPQGGKMVPVDKATYDAYWKHHGGRR